MLEPESVPELEAESASDSRTMKATTPFAAVVIGLSTVLALLSLSLSLSFFPLFRTSEQHAELPTRRREGVQRNRWTEEL